MFSILCNEKGGESKRLDFDKPEVTIGRVQGNDIILPKGNVSKRHSRIVLKDGKFIIVDLKSTNGTYVNGRKITSPLVVKSTDKIYIGDFILSIEEAGGAAASPPPPMDEPAPPPPRPRVQSSPAIPPPPPRRVAEDEDDDDQQDDAGESDSTMGPAGHDEPEDEPAPTPPPRRTAPPPPAQPIPTMRPTPSPTASPVGRTMEAPAPPPRTSQKDIPAIAPSRPTAQPARPVEPVAAPPARPVRPTNPPPPAAPPPRRPTTAAGEGQDAARRARIVDALRTLSKRLVTTLGGELESLQGDVLRERAETVANDLIGELAQESGLPPGIEPDQLLRDAVGEVVGMGPLDELLADESVTAITVSRPDRIFVDRQGQRSLVPRYISSDEAAHRIVERIARRQGRTAELEDARSHGGLFEARLEGGFLLSAVVGSLASGAASMVLRRARRDSSRLADLASHGALSQGMADFLEYAVRQRRNILVAGVAGSGRSTVIGALARASEGQRVVFVEESAELDAGDQPWISLSGAGGGARRAFAAALRMKPERLVVGDVRGAEALDVIGTLAGGLDGAVIGATASSSRDALHRLVTSARLAADAPDAHVLEGEVASAIHVVVVLQRNGEGEFRVAEIAEVVHGDDGPTATSVFAGADGRFSASGHIPSWAEGAPASMFRS